LFLAFAAAVLAAVAYAVGVAANRFAGFDLVVSFVLANALVACLWFVVSFVALNAGWRAVPTALLHPFFNLAFLFLWARTSFLEAGLAVESPIVTGVKLLLATAVLLVALWSLFYVINAPAKRNLGISAIQAAALFFAQTIRGSKEFEQVLEEMGEPVTAPVRAFSFETLRGKPKALFLVPSLHFGPFGNVGGSEYPARLSAELGQRHGRVFVFHGLVNHDFNPVQSSDYARAALAVEQALTRTQKTPPAKTAGFFDSRAGAASIAGFAFGKTAFASISRHPESTEDFEYGLGEALRAECARQLGSECAVADRHNCLTDRTEVKAGGEEFEEYESAARSLAPPRQGAFKLGVGVVTETGFAPPQGVGRGGIRAAVFEIRGKRYCLVLVDANNALPAFRDRTVAALKQEFGFEWAELATSDTHSVNSLALVYNPLPGSAPQDELLRAIKQAAALALRDLEFCRARFAEARVRLSVMGAESQSEMLSTINSIIAVAKIVAPIILIGSVVLVVAALLLWK
jgi:putative membrane protein